ncbi:MAG: hypothetical protein PHY88_01835 [Candidatus Omnitrophica bacterium]|nr:hypothetical protein [Candidatus Omnitrophota bacterium]
MKTIKVKLPVRLKKAVLALGSQTKNTICFAKGSNAYVSPVHADLSSPRDLSAFEKDVKHFLKKHPKIVTCDLHPEYQSTKFALSLYGSHKLALIQHHHAHIAACMAENGLKDQKVIGVAFDGTGLGSDNNIWGAEFLVCNYKTFVRQAHLKEIPLVGGERAVLEPWRVLAAWFGFDKNQDLRKVYQAGINSPLASSMGRLFDAVASLVLNKKKASFEAELPIALERLAEKGKLRSSGYRFNLKKYKDNYIIDPSGIFKQISKDLKSGILRKDVALDFHHSIASMIAQTCLVLRKRNKIKKVALSGGVFQNRLLLNFSSSLLYEEGFEVFTHQKLSCNDSCVSLGEAIIAGLRS